MTVLNTSVGAQPADRSVRQIITPEGVALTVRLADRGERAGAVLIDLLFIFGGILGLTLVFMFAFWIGGLSGAGELGAIMYLLLFFAIRSFYFIFFELRWDGVTPGKRIMKIRVIDRHGGPLTADAVFARNLMREVELFLPMSFLFAAPAALMGAWITLLNIVWVGVLVMLPFFNRDRLRAGDMIAGTWVIDAPKAVLQAEMANDAVGELSGRGGLTAEPAYRFTAAELGVYGIHELQILEDVLRDGHQDVRLEVAKRIAAKIGWAEADVVGDPKAFLEAFYTALRAELEGKMLFGVRRRDKFDTGYQKPGG